jgi:beta-fructofuranosidase
MFYTGASTAENALVQRIGVAFSEDLTTWRKDQRNPIVEIDPRWYETLDLSAWHDQAWRDPWVYPTASGFEMLITARSAIGRTDSRGVIGLATSEDLRSWTVRPPITRVGEFGHMEVPQRSVIEGVDILIFSCGYDHLSSEKRLMGRPVSSSYALPMSDSVPVSTAGAIVLETPNLYSCRAIRDSEGQWVVLGFELEDPSGRFGGMISDPVPLGDVAPGLVPTIEAGDP